MKIIDFEKVTWKLQGNPLKSNGISLNVTLPVISKSYGWAEKFHRVTARLRLNLLSLKAFSGKVTCNFSESLKRYTPYKKVKIFRVLFTRKRLAHTRLCHFQVTRLQGYISNSTVRFQSGICCNFSVTFSNKKVTPLTPTLNPIFCGAMS